MRCISFNGSSLLSIGLCFSHPLLSSALRIDPNLASFFFSCQLFFLFSLHCAPPVFFSVSLCLLPRVLLLLFQSLRCFLSRRRRRSFLSLSNSCWSSWGTDFHVILKVFSLKRQVICSAADWKSVKGKIKNPVSLETYNQEEKTRGSPFGRESLVLKINIIISIPLVVYNWLIESSFSTSCSCFVCCFNLLLHSSSGSEQKWISYKKQTLDSLIVSFIRFNHFRSQDDDCFRRSRCICGLQSFWSRRTWTSDSIGSSWFHQSFLCSSSSPPSSPSGSSLCNDSPDSLFDSQLHSRDVSSSNSWVWRIFQ